MNCEEVKKSIETLHDGAASERVKNRLEIHIANCSSCRAAFNRLRALSHLLQKESLPVPSLTLERNLMEAFRNKHERTAAKPASWWKTLFAGSINVPKPVFAAALIACALAFGWANLTVRNEAMSAAVNNSSTAPVVSLPIQPPPQTFQEIKVVEVPVIKERVITKTVYVESESGKAQETTNKSSIFSRNKSNAPDKKSNISDNSAVSGLQMSASIAENGYFTRADLKDFEPATESKIRIIRKEKADEK